MQSTHNNTMRRSESFAEHVSHELPDLWLFADALLMVVSKQLVPSPPTSPRKLQSSKLNTSSSSRQLKRRSPLKRPFTACQPIKSLPSTSPIPNKPLTLPKLPALDVSLESAELQSRKRASPRSHLVRAIIRLFYHQSTIHVLPTSPITPMRFGKNNN